MSATHQHEIQHFPPGSASCAVCACGATQRVERGRPVGPWHACSLCVNAHSGKGGAA